MIEERGLTADSFRYERKFHVTSLSRYEIESIVKTHPAIFSESYSPRYVNNIYFDSFCMNNFHDNLQGIAERKKTRIRWYNSLFGKIEKPTLEFKVKKGLLGKKISYPIPPFQLDCNTNFYMQVITRICNNSDISEFEKIELKRLKPMLLNRYKRKYFLSADKRFRITIDTDLEFHRIDSVANAFNRIPDNSSVILELKYGMDCDSDANKITNLFPFRVTKSSKYIIGIERVLVS